MSGGGMASTDIDDAIERERTAAANVLRLADELATAAVPIASLGDGNCGVVIHAVLKALAAHGLYIDPRSTKPQQPKKRLITQALRTKVFERDAYRCVHCQSHVDLSVDHIKPESVGGTLEMSNLQTLCRSCNSRKGVRE